MVHFHSRLRHLLNESLETFFDELVCFLLGLLVVDPFVQLFDVLDPSSVQVFEVDICAVLHLV